MHHDLTNMRATLRAAQTAESFADWLRDDGDQMLAAAELLGGQAWRDRADAVRVAVSGGVPLVELISELSDLYQLLSLEFTDDLDSVEAALFFAVHPDDPRADEARLCAEALEQGLSALAIVAGASSTKSREVA
jgi:hypothetical protein